MSADAHVHICIFMYNFGLCHLAVRFFGQDYYNLEIKVVGTIVSFLLGWGIKVENFNIDKLFGL